MTVQEGRSTLTRGGLLAGAAAGGAGVAAALVESAPVLAAATRSPDPPGAATAAKPAINFNYILEGTGLALGSFSRCHGLTAGVQVIEFRDGSKPLSVRKLPGNVTFPQFALSRPLNNSSVAAEWVQMVVSGEIADARKNCSLAIVAPNGTVLARYELVRAWPSSFEIGQMSVEGSEVLMESLTIACEGFRRVAP